MQTHSEMDYEDIEARYQATQRLFCDSRLSQSDVRCAGHLLGCVDGRWPSISEIAAYTRKSRTSIERAVAKLHRLGIIHRIPGGGTRRNEYVLKILDNII